MKSFYNRILDYTTDQKFILLTAIAMFMPFYIGIGVLIVDMFYFVYQNKFKEIFDKTNLSVFGLIFAVYSLVVSIVFNNTYGILATVGMFVLFVFVLFIRKNMTEQFMEDCMIIIMLFASFCFLITLTQYSIILKNNSFNYAQFMKYISENRTTVGTFFFNANYYAMVCSLVGIISAYKYFSTESFERFFSFVVGILSVLTLLITDSRGAMFASFIAVFALTIMMKKRKYTIAIISLFALGFVGIVAAGRMDLIPRIDKIGFDMGLRKSIWISAIEAFKKNFVIGVGPLGIHNIYATIRNRAIVHSHNLYLDILVNFGLIGAGLLVPIICQLFKEIKSLYSKKYTKMIIAMIIMVMIHSMVDVTIFWTQTSFIFLTFVVGVGELSTVPVTELSLFKNKKSFNTKNIYEK
ncbi:O-antigen ligase family protein [Finegoldia magna]|uniref:O-antigen ligase family protein n=1 Tax=Finegoldia magna TaxID=1260 RepID=UPI000B91C95C|nr:O-antigen ligase family protein [Finegoldia magna]OXZ35681.1 polymerase [Finegoldia magna]